MNAALAFCLCCTDMPIQAEDVLRFPLDAQCCVAQADHFRGELEVELLSERTDQAFWREWLVVSHHSVDCWAALASAQEGYRGSDGWQNPSWSLRMLRERIGNDAFYAGEMPLTRPWAPRLFAPHIR